MAPVLGALRALGVDGRRRRPGRACPSPCTAADGARRRGHPRRLGILAVRLRAAARPVPGSTMASRCTTTGKAVPSLPHIEMTVETLRDAGVVVDDGDVHTWRVEPSEVNALDVQVEPDLSNAAPFLAAALVTGGRVQVPGWPQYTTQAGDFIRDVLDMMGAEVVLDRAGPHRERRRRHLRHRRRPARLQRAHPGRRRPVRAGRLPERHPWHRPHPRPRDRPARRPAHASSPRSAPTSTRPTTACGSCPARCTPAPFHTYADHRMAMAAAVLGLRVPGLVVEDVGTVAKTLPEFTQLWEPDARRPGHRRAPDGTSGRAALRRVRRPDPAQPQGNSAAHQGPTRPRGRRARSGHRRRPGPLHDPRRRGRRTATSSSPCRPASSAARASSSVTTSASSATPRAPTAAWPASCASNRATPCCGAPPTTPTRSSGCSSPTPTSSSSSPRWPTPSRGRGSSTAASSPPTTPGWSRCSCSPRPTSPTRHRSSSSTPPLSVRHLVTARHDGTHRRPRRPARGPVRPGQRARRALRRRQVHARQRPRAPGAARHRRRQRRHRARAAHLDLGGGARPARRRRLGHRHPRRPVLRPGPRRPGAGSSSTSPTSSRAPTQCPRGCTHDEEECGLDAWVAGGGAGPAGPSRLDSLRRLLRARTPTTDD